MPVELYLFERSAELKARLERLLIVSSRAAVRGLVTLAAEVGSR